MTHSDFRNQPNISFSSVKIVFAAILFIFSFARLSAQNDSVRSTVSIQIGSSMAGTIIAAYDLDDSISSVSYPVVQLAYDYGFKNWFSLGAATSYQQFNMTYTDRQLLHDDYGVLSGSIDAKLTRINFSMRALFHYGQDPRIDMYSGVRLGYTKWKLSAKYSELFNAEDFKYGLVAPQLILFGFRGYFTDHFGAGGELCIGSPYFFAAGVNYRF